MTSLCVKVKVPDEPLKAPLASPDVSMLSSSSESSCLHSIDNGPSLSNGHGHGGCQATDHETEDDDFLSSVLNAAQRLTSPAHSLTSITDCSSPIGCQSSRDYTPLANHVQDAGMLDNWRGSSATLVGSLKEITVLAVDEEERQDATTVAQLAMQLTTHDEERFNTPTNSPRHIPRFTGDPPKYSLSPAFHDTVDIIGKSHTNPPINQSINRYLLSQITVCLSLFYQQI